MLGVHACTLYAKCISHCNDYRLCVRALILENRQKLSQYCKLITESNYFPVMNEVQEPLILYTKCYRYLYFNSNSSKNNCS